MIRLMDYRKIPNGFKKKRRSTFPLQVRDTARSMRKVAYNLRKAGTCGKGRTVVSIGHLIPGYCGLPVYMTNCPGISHFKDNGRFVNGMTVRTQIISRFINSKHFNEQLEQARIVDRLL